MTVDEIKQKYSMPDILMRYGLKPNRSGFICCPFHKEKTPSLKVKEKTWRCHGCGKNGDIFTFVQEMENCSFKDAYLSLGGTYENVKEDFGAKLRLEASMRAQEKRVQADLRRKKLKRELSELITFYKAIYATYEPMSDTWCKAYMSLFYLIYAYDEKYIKENEVNVSGIISRYSKPKFVRDYIG